jgi:hypothetical protein
MRYFQECHAPLRSASSVCAQREDAQAPAPLPGFKENPHAQIQGSIAPGRSHALSQSTNHTNLVQKMESLSKKCKARRSKSRGKESLHRSGGGIR